MPESERQDLATSSLWQQTWQVKTQALLVAMGDLTLTIQRRPHEWQLRYAWQKQGALGDFRSEWVGEESLLDESAPTSRIALDRMTADVTLLPRLADRPVVVRPISPLTLAGQSKITLYVSTPVWLEVVLSERISEELPVQQLSDTWMGGVTGNGELCYGSHTHARLDASQLLNLPYRVLTPVEIHNKSSESRKLERLSLPCPYLSVFSTRGLLATEPLTITMDAEKSRGVVQIGAPQGSVKALTKPRKVTEKGMLISAWANLFA
ncbi:hypothetical protein [Halioxenophilus sp. WMMB6]|uniref:hypothetical protein n=1 Tax=Halioxenophilus sp. WMMB6 TaxID=3073815 RepID=UPI00295E7BD7|nr:hypothetical protein [Halioxenophilus sp. WMMB6]